MNKRFRKAIGKQGLTRSSKDRAKRDLGLEALEDRQLLAANPQLVAILPNSGELLQQGRVLNKAPDELLIRFDENQSIDPSSLNGIRLISSGGDQVFGNGNDTTITPGFIGIGEELNEVIIRFGEALSDDLYQIQIVGFGADALRNNSGDPFDNDPNVEGLQDLEFNFRLDLGAKVTAVVPQPVSRAADGSLVQARNQIVVYFNDDDLNPSLAQNPALYQLIETNETATNQDDSVPITPVSVAYDANADKAILSFGRDLDQLSSGSDTYRLRIGNSEAIPAPPIRTEVGGDPGSSYDSSFDLGVLAGRGRVIASSIDPQLSLVTFPGSNDDPGSRNIPYRGEQHVQLSADGRSGTTTIAYNFRNELGADENGSPFFNFITEDQKQRAREAFELWSNYAGVEFIESETSGITIGFGDLRAITPQEIGGRGDGTYLATFTDPTFETGIVVLDVAEQWDDAFGDNSNPAELSWFKTAMAGIGQLIGLGNATDLPSPTILSNDSLPGTDVLFPGPYDITHAQHVHRPDSIDVDLYKFEVSEPGVVTIETSAERLTNASLLDSTLLLFRESLDGTREVIGQNDDYFSNDSFIKLSLEPGTYYVGISSTGNADYDPDYENSGSGGTTQGRYELRIDFSPQVDNLLRDTSGTAFDGDADGNPSGVFNYWFRATTEANTVYVDKAATGVGNGSRTSPYTRISQALAVAREGDIVRIVGNGGADGDLATVEDNLAYLVGFDLLGQPLPDGTTLSVPKGVTVMVEAGTTFKMSSSTVQVGSTSPEVDRSKAAFQVLGTPEQQVFFTSFNDESIGQDTNLQLATTPAPGDWGGIAIRNDVDQGAGRFTYESEGVFLNYVAFADMQYGGGMVVIDSIQQVVTPIDMTNARPTVVYTRITDSADAAMSANPDSFEETTFHAPSFQSVPFTSDYSRIGPDLTGNILVDNSTNGLFVQIQTPAGEEQQELTVAGRWDDTDITHIVAENLIIQGQPGGPIGTQISGNTNIPVVDRFFLTSRLDASLVIDPGIVVKVDGARIETGIGAQLIAEGSPNRNVIFTSIDDDRYGAGGTFDARSDGISTVPEAGDWAGIYFGHVSDGSLDNVFLAYAGGITKIEGTFTGFNAVEIHQADVRITNSVFDDNALGTGGQAPANRLGRGANAPGVIFVLGAEPIIVNNTFRDTLVGFGGGFGPAVAPAINIDANSLSHRLVNDWGRSTGSIDTITDYQDNHGALIRVNEFINNETNGMVVRGGVLTGQSVWDDTDVVHVVFDEIVVPNYDSLGGLRLESSPTESLVVKFSGENAGLTATGQALDIADRIGGSIQVIGQPSHPVILTSLGDDSVGAGFVNDTDNNGQFANPAPGDWRGITIDALANDRNVAVVLEQELPTAVSPGANDTPSTAELIGNLAPNENSGDDNRRLGFEVHGFLNQSTDVDVYSFKADTGTQVWIDIDRTAAGLDTVIELVTTEGVVLASSDNSASETASALGPASERLGGLTGAGRPMDVTDTLPGDLYSTNQFDAGMRLALPGSIGQAGTYHVVVRSGDYSEATGGNSSGAYQLQVRLREIDEVPGNMIKFADISYAENGISVLGQPGSSPLLGDFSETNGANDDLGSAQDLGNLLVSNQGGLTVSGQLTTADDVDWYQVEVQYESVTRLSPDEAVSVVFDIDYADGLGRPDAMLSLFTPGGELVATSNNAGVADDIPKPNAGSDTSDLSRGSVGAADPMLGPIQLIPGTYYVAVSGGTMPAAFAQFEDGTTAADNLARFEPLDSINRVGEDHADFFTVARSTTAEDPQIPIIFGEEFAIVIPDGVDIREGETIAVESLAGPKVTFEFDSEGFFLIPPDPADLVEGETFSVRSIPFFGGASTLETFRLTRQGFSLDIKAPNRISDGDSFFIEGPTGFIPFEFDSDFLSPTGNAISFVPGQTSEEIALSVADAVNATGVLTATAVGSVVQLGNASGVFSPPNEGYDVVEPGGGGGDNLVFYDLNESQLEIATNIADAINATGVATASVTGLHSYRVQIQNAQDVILSQGGGMVANQPIRAGNFPIPYTTADDATTIGTAIETAINSAMSGIGVRAFSTLTTSQGAEVTLTDSSTAQTFFGSTTFSFTDPNPIVGLSPGSDISLIRPGIVPYTLQDVTLFVVDATPIADNTNSHLATYDAYTGAQETIIGPFAEVVGDLATRDSGRGELYSMTYTNNDRERNDGTSGTTIRIGPTNATTEQLGEDSIATFVAAEDPTSAENANDGAGAGIDYQAMTFIAGNRFVAVGSRNDSFGRPDPTAEEYADNPFILQGNEYRSNLVYLFDENGAAISDGDPRGGDTELEYLGGGTDIRELGHIDTVNDVGNTTGTILIGVPATNTGAFGANITDGMTLEFQDGSSRVVFEFESGPEAQLTANPSIGQTVRDGELFIVDGTRFTFDTGGVIVVETNGGGFSEGDSITIIDDNDVARTFEFDSDGSFGDDRIAIPYSAASGQGAMINAIVNAINGADFRARAVSNGNRISLTNDSSVSSSSSGVRTVGSSGVAAGVALPVEEFYTNDQIAEVIVNAFRSVSPITVSYSVGRLNFLGANAADFSGTSVATNTGARSGLNDPNAEPIEFLVDDDANTISARIMNAINQRSDSVATQLTNGTISVVTNGSAFTSTDSTITIGGAPTGGTITGVAFPPDLVVGQTNSFRNVLYAVSDQGGLFEFDIAAGTSKYVATATDLVGIQFTGLTFGPQDVDFGRYANTLFAIDAGGSLHAFDTLGQSVPVFANGASSVSTGAIDPVGLAFGSLQENLWATGADVNRFLPGHGVEIPVTDSRLEEADGGNASYHFGVPSDDPAFRNFNYPGGSHGTMVSNSFSLKDYSASDQPMLYFNYWLANEGAVYNPNANPPQPMRDSMRVYIMDDRIDGDRGEWYLLATNNEYRNDLEYDEFDDMDINDGIHIDVQELYDNTSEFRQARVSLAEFAGRENLRLRFEFSSAGGVSLGNDQLFSTGSFGSNFALPNSPGFGGQEGTELYAVPADRIRDGHTFQLGGYNTGFFGGGTNNPFGAAFEFDLGFTLVPPSGDRIPDGETFTLVGNSGTSVTYEFDKDDVVGAGNVGIVVRDSMSASDVAASMEQALATSDLGQPTIGDANFVGNLQFEGNDSIALAIDTGLNPSATGVFLSTGQIGDNQAVASFNDVDFVKFDLDIGDSAQIRIPTSSVNVALRLFDSNGIELLSTTGFGGTPALDFTASVEGTYYVGIGSTTNATYDPLTGVSPAGNNANTGIFGDYQIQITTGGSRLTTFLTDNRLNMRGLSAVQQGNDPLLFVDGSPGVQDSGATPVLINGGMSEVEVASAIEKALGAAYSQGDDSWVIRREEMIKIGGRDVIDAGPLGKSDHLWGDFTSAFNWSWSSQGYAAGPFGGLDNTEDGAYIDDIIIGFAERGELVTNASANTAFIPRTDISNRTIVAGPYQLEIRESVQYGTPDDENPNLDLLRGFDTNERLTDAVRLSVPDGAELSTGQTFTVGDGQGEVTFEYVDATITEGNDTIATAEPSNLPGGLQGSYVGLGQIGGNQAFGGDNSNVPIGTDVDFIELDLQENDLVVIDVDSYNPDDLSISPSNLDSALILFDERGNFLAISDDDLGPGDLDIRPAFLDPALTFVAPLTGKYYVAVSQAQNINYDPTVAGSGVQPTSSVEFREPSFRNNVIVIEEQPTILTGGTYQVNISLNGGPPPAEVVTIPFASFDSSNDIANRVASGINSSIAQSRIDFTAAPVGSIVDLHGDNIVVTAVATSLVPESNDTLETATKTNAVVGRSSRFQATGEIGDNANLDFAGLDIDLFEVDLEFGGLLTVDVDAFDVGSSLRAGIIIFDDAGNPLDSAVTDPTAFTDPTSFLFWDPLTPLDRKFTQFDPTIEFRAPETGTYYVGISATNRILRNVTTGATQTFVDPLVEGSGQLIDPFYNTGSYTALIQVGDGSIGVEINDLYGDTNIRREQGALILDSNRITNSSDYGIRVDAGDRDNQDSPRPGTVRNLPDINVNGLVPGVVITNNVVARSGTGGILFSGDPGGDQVGAVPFGRIVNNTIYGAEVSDLVDPTRGTVGIQVTENASPTLLNNIVSEFGTGIAIDETSQTTVVGGTLYHSNDTNSIGTLGDFPIQIGGFQRLFEDPLRNNFYLVDGSLAIDSSIDSLADRVDLVNIRDTLGIPVSPILAPDFDNAGQLRVDDPNVQTPVGQGENVFKDRGAIDRSDFTGPRALLVSPLDNDPAGKDTNPAEGTVIVPSAVLENFVIELIDNTGNGGIGVDDDSVTASVISVRRDGVLLTEGEDYRFEYSRTNNQIRLSPITGIWPPNSSFQIELDNSSVEDLAGNNLSPNERDGDTIFVVSTDLGRDFGDAPTPYPSSLDQGGARHQLIDGFFLGTGVDAEVDIAGIDDLDDGITFGSSFVGGLTSEITVLASNSGFIDAWVDWNGDGDWNDVGELLLDKREVATGSNTFIVRAPDGIPLGNTYARFRLSSLGGLTPTGLAADGEVEDYAVTVGTNPWQNPANRLDVDDVNGATPLDALLIINELNDFVHGNDTSGRLPIPGKPGDAPFYDVNGDGFVSPLDALLIINSLSSTNAVAETPIASAAPLGARVEVVESVAGFAVAPIDVNHSMSVEVRPASVKDSIWAADAADEQPESVIARSGTATRKTQSHRNLSMVERRASDTVEPQDHQWNTLVDDLFDDELGSW